MLVSHAEAFALALLAQAVFEAAWFEYAAKAFQFARSAA